MKRFHPIVALAGAGTGLYFTVKRRGAGRDDCSQSAEEPGRSCIGQKIRMASAKKTFEAVKRGQGVVSFRDLKALLTKLGFRLDRVSGSHHIFLHPKVTRPMNIQPMGKDAKPYQIRQLWGIIEEFGLKLED